MKNNGFLKLKRSFFSHELWIEERVYNRSEAFIDLLQMAAFAPMKRIVRGKLIHLERGELVASERFLETRWKWSRTKVRCFIKLLESEGMINQQKNQSETVLTLCNYKAHADRDFEKEPAKEPVEYIETTKDPPKGDHEKDHEKTTPIPYGDLILEDYEMEKEPQKNRKRTSDHTTEEPNDKNSKKIKKIKKIKKEETPSALPTFPDPDLESAWKEWCQHLKEKKSKTTPTAKLKQIANLQKMTKVEAIASINTSIASNWQGLFPPKNATNFTDTRKAAAQERRSV